MFDVRAAPLVIAIFLSASSALASELLHNGAGWIHSFDSEAAGRGKRKPES
jgi:hypothetical protein